MESGIFKAAAAVTGKPSHASGGDLRQFPHWFFLVGFRLGRKRVLVELTE